MANSGFRVVALIAAACGGCDEEPPTPAEKPIAVQFVPPPAPQVPRPPLARPITAKRVAAWSNVESANCVFFSGPNGRDTQLFGEVEILRMPDDAVALRFVDANATFTGTVHDGELRLERRTDYDNYGDAWKTTETIKGRMVGGKMLTRYHYEECKVGDPPCPGTCTIDADLTFDR